MIGCHTFVKYGFPSFIHPFLKNLASYHSFWVGRSPAPHTVAKEKNKKNKSVERGAITTNMDKSTTEK